MLPDLIRALSAACLVGFVPGWFWARCLCAPADRAERLTYAVALSMALLATTALLVLAAGIVPLVSSLWEPAPEEPSLAEAFPGMGSPVARRTFLPVVLLLVLARGYVGPAVHDWPFMRGVDHYSHAVMANLMMARGRSSRT